jgi:hypothetical protein
MNTLYTNNKEKKNSVHKITTTKTKLRTQYNNNLCTECSFCRCYFVYRVFILSLLFCLQCVHFVVVILCTECSFCRCYFVYRVFILSLLFCVQSSFCRRQNEHAVHKITTTKWTHCNQNNNDKMNTLYTNNNDKKNTLYTK